MHWDTIAHCHCHCYFDCEPHGYAFCYADSEPHGYAFSYADSFTNNDTYGNSNNNTYCSADRNTSGAGPESFDSYAESRPAITSASAGSSLPELFRRMCLSAPDRHWGGFRPVADPVLELHGPTGFVTIINDNCDDGFPVPPPCCTPGSLDAAIEANLDPGAYGDRERQE